MVEKETRAVVEPWCWGYDFVCDNLYRTIDETLWEVERTREMDHVLTCLMPLNSQMQQINSKNIVGPTFFFYLLSLISFDCTKNHSEIIIRNKRSKIVYFFFHTWKCVPNKGGRYSLILEGYVLRDTIAPSWKLWKARSQPLKPMLWSHSIALWYPSCFNLLLSIYFIINFWTSIMG